MANKRRYSDDQRATALAALAANAGNLSRTAAELRLPLSTLECWAKGTRHPEAAAIAEGKKERLADAIEEAARAIVERIAGKVEDAGLKDAAVALGILVDKCQLLRGKPTAVTGHSLSDLSDDDLDAELEAAERALAEAQAGEGGPRGQGAQGAA